MFIDYDIVYQIDLLSWKKKISRFEVKYGFYLSDSSISTLQKKVVHFKKADIYNTEVHFNFKARCFTRHITENMLFHFYQVFVFGHLKRSDDPEIQLS